MDQWWNDKDFKATPGQEVTQEVFLEMLNCMPPQPLPRKDYGRPVQAGFMMGEPTDSSPAGALYRAFGANSGRYYYLGLHTAEEEA